MRSRQEQAEGLDRMIRAAMQLHRINLQMRQQPGDVMEATGHGHAEDVSAVYVTDGYDLWVGGELFKTNLSLEAAAAAMADAYMAAKAWYVITRTWRMPAWIAQRVLDDAQERQWLFGEMDAGSNNAAEMLAKRYTN